MSEKNERKGMIMKIQKHNNLFNKNDKILWIELDKKYILKYEIINIGTTHNNNFDKIERKFDGIVGLVVDESVTLNDISFDKDNSNKYVIDKMRFEMKYGRNIGIFNVKN
jgi:hypothetical protein